MHESLGLRRAARTVSVTRASGSHTLVPLESHPPPSKPPCTNLANQIVRYRQTPVEKRKEKRQTGCE